MAKVKAVSSSERNLNSRPALSPEARLNQMIAMAEDLAEKQIREGTATSQLLTHYLKQGTRRELLELERLKEENRLLRAKAEAIQNEKDSKILYQQALKAMRSYSGHDDDEFDDEEDWDDENDEY